MTKLSYPTTSERIARQYTAPHMKKPPAGGATISTTARPNARPPGRIGRIIAAARAGVQFPANCRGGGADCGDARWPVAGINPEGYMRRFGSRYLISHRFFWVSWFSTCAIAYIARFRRLVKLMMLDDHMANLAKTRHVFLIN